MSPEKIMKLRELAERGVGGEKQNAIDILAKNGIDWRKPKESFVNRVKQAVNINIEKEYAFDFRRSTDFLLLQVLAEVVIGTRVEIQLDAVTLNAKIRMTPAQYQKVYYLYLKNQDNFAMDMIGYARSEVHLKYS